MPATAPVPHVSTWISPNGVEHTIVRGHCMTCGKPHGHPVTPIGESARGDRVQFVYRGKLIEGRVYRVKKDGTRTVEVTGDDAFHAIGNDEGLVDVWPPRVIP